MSPRLRAYVVATVLAAAGVMAFVRPQDLAHTWGHLVAWAAMCVVSERLSTRTESGATWSLAATVGLASAVVWGIGAGIWVSALSTLVADVAVHRKPAVRVAFNTSQIALATGLAGALFDVLGGRGGMALPTGASLADPLASLRLLLPFIGLMLGYFAVNRAMVSLAVAWSSERGWWRVLREEWLYMARLEHDVASFLLTPLMAIAYTTVGYPGVALFYAPLYMLHRSDRRFDELKRAEALNLRNARFAAKGELAAGIGHELNNQLVAISARAQMLMRDAAKQSFEQAPKHAEIIFEQSKRMGTLAQGLMDYTRSAVKLEPMDLNAMVAKTIDFVQTDKRFRGVEWDVVLDPEVPSLRGDVGQLQGVFINLFVNAADAMGAQTTRRAIVVRTRLDARTQSVTATVQDTGPGIKKEHLPRMFEFMFTTKENGHGFGLSTSYRTVENHGGRMSVDSPAGEGARFEVTLPLAGPGGGR